MTDHRARHSADQYLDISRTRSAIPGSRPDAGRPYPVRQPSPSGPDWREVRPAVGSSSSDGSTTKATVGDEAAAEVARLHQPSDFTGAESFCLTRSYFLADRPQANECRRLDLSGQIRPGASTARAKWGD